MASNYLEVRLEGKGLIHINDDRRPAAAITIVYDFQREAWLIWNDETEAEVVIGMKGEVLA
jgi:hypothetical protein